MKKISLPVIVILALSVAANAQQIFATNGNFTVSYSDIEIENHPLNFGLSRTYSSIGADPGWFGVGWATFFETYLVAIPGGGVHVAHWGQGSTQKFRPRQWDSNQVNSCIDQLVRIKSAQLNARTPEEVTTLKNRLLTDEDYRNKQWQIALADSLVKNLRIPTGTKLTSEWIGTDYVEVIAGGYKLFLEDGRQLLFDKNGQLTQVAGNEANISLSYKDGALEKMSDNLGNHVYYQFNDGLLQSAEVVRADGKKENVSYTYNMPEKTLASSRDTENNYYRFEWDNRFNMVRVRYTDGSTMEITYDENNMATRLKARNGSWKDYEYITVSNDEYGTNILHYDSLGNTVKTISTWQVMRTTELGDRWEYKRRAVVDGDSITYINNQKFGNPDTAYVNNGVYYTFQYTRRGELTNILKNGKQLLQLKGKEGKLTSFTVEETTFHVVYNGYYVEKLIAPDKSEIAFPLSETENDPKNYKALLSTVLPAFRFTQYWPEFRFGD